MEEMIECWIVKLANGDKLVVKPAELEEDDELWDGCVILESRWYTEQELEEMDDY